MLFQAMKKRNPHDISDMASPDEKIAAVSSYRLLPQLRIERVVSAEAKSEDVEKNKEKSSYEFGQPAFRRDLRKQIEVGVFAVLLFQGSRRGQKHSSFYLQESKADLFILFIAYKCKTILHLMLLTLLSHCRLTTICCIIVLGETHNRYRMRTPSP